MTVKMVSFTRRPFRFQEKEKSALSCRKEKKGQEGKEKSASPAHTLLIISIHIIRLKLNSFLRIFQFFIFRILIIIRQFCPKRKLIFFAFAYVFRDVLCKTFI